MKRSLYMLGIGLMLMLASGGCNAQASQRQEQAQKILQEIAAGRNAKEISQPYLASGSHASPDRDRASEIRQLQQARRDLLAALKRWQGSRDNQAQVQLAWQQWQAASTILDGRHQAIEASLQNNAGQVVHLTRQREMMQGHQNRQQQIQTLLGNWVGSLPAASLDGKSRAPAKSAASGAANTANTANITRAVSLLSQQRAGRREPVLHALNLPVGPVNLAPRPPKLTPAITPSYGASAETVAQDADLADAPDAPLSDEILFQAKSLGNDYVRIYEFVRNGVRSEWYVGAVKGATGTLRSKAGNDLDQASLLIALLRVAGVPARYVHGVVELPLDQIAQDLGLADTSLVQQAMGKIGLAFTPVARGGRVVALQLEHNWVSAYVPYTNYRGAVVDASGKSWIPLDPSWKQSQWRATSVTLAEIGGNATLQKDYLSQVPTQSFADFIKKRTVNYLESKSGGAVDYEAQLGQQQITPLSLSVLPNTLPYPVLAVNSEGATLPESEQMQVRIRLMQDNKAALDTQIAMNAANNQRLSLSYLPASLEDHRVALLFGGLDSVPLYLIKLRPQLALGGKVYAIGNGELTPGSELTLEVTFSGPAGSQTIKQSLMAGALQVLNLAGTASTRPSVPAPADTEGPPAHLLDGIATAYANAWYEGEARLASLAGVSLLRPQPGITIVTNHLETVFLDDVPQTFAWQGVTLDAINHPLDAVGPNARDFLQLAALHGSSLESQLFQNQFAVEAISADKGLALAQQQGIALLHLAGANANALDASDHTQAVRDQVKQLLRLGYRVDIPASRISLAAWNGSVWRAQDDAGGANGYFISGSLAGGSTATAPNAWPLDFLADALRAQNSDGYNKDPQAGIRLLKIGMADGQFGVVGKPMKTPMTVLLRDKNGLPVKGAKIKFTVAAGDGSFNGSVVYETTTNELGQASANLLAGTKTDQNPQYVFLDGSKDIYPTRVGMMVVDASASNEQGGLRLEQPFQVFAKPDKLSVLKSVPPLSPVFVANFNSTWGILAQDQYDNPIANADVTFDISTSPTCDIEKAGQYLQAGTLFDITTRSSQTGAQSRSSVLAGRTDALGGVIVGVLLGNAVGGINTIQATAGGLRQTFVMKALGVCGLEPSVTMEAGGYLLSSNGDNVSAAAPFSKYKNPLVARIWLTESDYEIRVNGSGNPYVYYFGYVRKRETSGSIEFPVRPDGFTSGLSQIGLGAYRADLTVGSPGRDDITPKAIDARVSRFVLVPGTPPVLERRETGISFSGPTISVFSVKPVIEKLIISGGGEIILLNSAGRSINQLGLQYKINPDEYTALGAGFDLYKNGVVINSGIGDKARGSGIAYLPRDQVFDIDSIYEAELVLNRGSSIEVRSERFPLPIRQKLIQNATGRGPKLEVDVLNQRACDIAGSIDFAFTQSVTATLELEPIDSDGNANGARTTLFQNRNFEAGAFFEPIEAARIGSGTFRFILSATGVRDPSQHEMLADQIKSLYQRYNRLPVGHVLIKGVDLKTGGLTAQSQALAVNGRGPAFHFQPTYSSGNNGEIGSMGSNWSHNFESGIHINGCGEVLVSAGDGGSVRFFPASDGKLIPERGYHATLVRNDTDHSFDFYSKDGSRYHYRFMNQRVQWKVDFIEDSNGNRLSMNYDLEAIPAPLLLSVKAGDGREFTFKYTRKIINQPGTRLPGSYPFLSQVNGPDNLQMSFEHDESGNLTSVNRNGRIEKFAYNITDNDFRLRTLLKAYTDPNGNVTGYQFNDFKVSFNQGGYLIELPNSHVTRVQTPTGEMSFNFNLPGYDKASVTDENGHATAYELNPHGSPTQITDPVGVTKMTWSETDITMLSKTDARGVTTEYDYDSAANMIREKVGSISRSYTYLIQEQAPWIKNRKTSHTDRNGNLTQYLLDGKGNLQEEQMPESIVIKHSYANNGDRLQTTDGLGGITRFGYDDFGNLAASTDQVGNVQQTLRDGRGRVKTGIDGNGNQTKFLYDAQDRLISRVDAKGKERTIEYDVNGNKTAETDEAGRKTEWHYNNLNLPDSIKHPDGNSKTLEYDKVGNKTAESDFRGNNTRYDYDGANRLISRTEPLGKITRYEYDGIGNVTAEIDALGRKTSHAYDDLSRRTRTIDAANGVWDMAYDGNGNKTMGIDAEGRKTEYQYDGLNRLRQINQELGRSTLYYYDVNHNKIAEVIPDDNGKFLVTRYKYDPANRIKIMTDRENKATLYDYDKSNNLIRTVDANVNVKRYSYDALNRRSDMTDGEGYLTRYSYDEVGNQIGEEWPNGNQITYGYDVLNRKTFSGDSVGTIAQWDYDPDGNTISETDANGNVSTHQYNALNQRNASQLPLGRSMRYEYDLLNNRLSMHDPNGNKTSYRYDALNRQIGSTDALGGIHSISYDKVGNKISETNPNGNLTQYSWDKLNRQSSMQDALGFTMRYYYDVMGKKTLEIDKRGIETRFVYDNMQRLALVARAGLALLFNSYDGAGNLLFTTDAKQKTTNYEYDKRNLRIAENRLLGAISKIKLDTVGDRISSTDPEGRVSTYSHDKRRRMLAMRNAAGESTSYEYDGNGHQTSITHPLGNRTLMIYDAANRVSEVQEPAGTTRYEYDRNGNHTRLTDGNGNITDFSWDALNRRTGILYPGGAKETFGYDSNGNLTSHTDGNGVVVGHVYDALNRETTKTFANNPDGLRSITTDYDKNNNVVAVKQIDNAGEQSSSYGYDDFDRQQTHTDAFGAKANTSYDANGNKASLITQDGKVTRYSYDDLNRLTGIVGQSGTVNYEYDRSSLNTKILYSNGTSSTMNYDAAKRVKELTHAKGNSNFSRTQYEYDKNGNRLSEIINRAGAAQATSYQYDTQDRLTQTKVIDVAKTVTTDYEFDSVGNRTKETLSTTPAGGAMTVTAKTLRYDGRNQLIAISDSVAGDTGLSYDNQGNLVQKTRGSDITTYRYDARDYLLGVSQNATVLGNYRNDHLGLRIEKEAKDPLQPGAPPVTLRTLWDGRMAFQDRSTDGDTLSRYDSDGRHPVGMWSKDDGAQALHHDALGSIVATTDNTGAVKSETIYDAFGNVQEEKGKSANKFGYTGHQMDKESGLIYFQARYYDPQIGRFITQDPFEGDWMTPMSLHHYLYAYGNPTGYIDLHGYSSVSTDINNAADSCESNFCRGVHAVGYAFWQVGTLGFATVHDPVKDAYDEGRATRKQYAVGVAGASVAVGVNVTATVFTGGTGTAAATAATTSVVSRLVTAAGTGAAIALANDSVAQATHVNAGIQTNYKPEQAVEAAYTGAKYGAVGGAFVESAIAGVQAGRNGIAAYQIAKVINETEPAAVQRAPPARLAVEAPTQSVRTDVITGQVTREGATLATEADSLGAKGVAAEVSASKSATPTPRPGDAAFIGPINKGGWRLKSDGNGEGAHLVEKANVRGRPDLAHFVQAETPRYYPSGSIQLAGKAHQRLHRATKAEGIKLGNSSLNDEQLLEAYRRAYSRTEVQGIRGDVRTPTGKPIPGGAGVSPSAAFDALLKAYE